MKFMCSVLSLLLVCSQVSTQRRVIQSRPPNRNQASSNDGDTRLGLLANQFGVNPVPGGTQSTGGFQNSASLVGSRDDGCWCQPVNQPCTDLRPENLDLVTRIINRPGSPGSFGQPTSGNCLTDQRTCCPRGASGAFTQGSGLQGVPGQGVPFQGVPGQGVPFQGVPGQGIPGQGVPFQGVPGQGFPGRGVPGQGFQGQGVPSQGFPVQGVPFQGVPGQSFPGQGVPSQGFPGPGVFGQCGIRKSFGIPGISPTADMGEYPWMAVILGPGQAYISGGALISSSWVLTAAHKLSSSRGLTVRLGDYDVSKASEYPQYPHYEVPVKRVIVHPNFNRKTLAADVALLELSIPVNLQQYAHVTPACLPSTGQKFDGRRCFVSGWGKNAFGPGNFQRILQEVDVPVVDSFRCQTLLQRTKLGRSFRLDQRAFICAGGEKDKDACQGDGGSPLVCGSDNGVWTVAGLVAWGVGCGQQNVPAAYVNVATYSDFIKQYVG